MARKVSADEFFSAAKLDDDVALEGRELQRVFWRWRGQQKELERKEAFWASTNAALADAYKELGSAREQLVALNEKLEQRVAAQVEEIVRRAAEIEALNVQLRVQVQERSRELIAALGRLGEQPHTMPETAVLGERVRLVRLIGRGGMGEVYLGDDLLTKQRVAVKVMRSAIARSPDSVRRFAIEATAAASVQHPGIVRTLHIDVTDDGRVYQIMDYAEGETLARRIGSSGLSSLECAFIGSALAEALSAAHRAGVVHRDIKPSNVMVSNVAPYVRILDFGIAKALDASVDELTKTGEFLGTPQYMSPEQIRDASIVTAPADIYSVGVLLFEMTTGRLPFTATSPGGYCMAHLLEDPPDVRSVATDAPEALAALIARCLRKDPASRPTAEELAQELARIRGEDTHRDVPPTLSS